MAGAGGEEVGKISIRVVPNLGPFREQMEATLAYYSGRKVEIEVVAKGLAQVKTELAAVAKDTKATVEAQAKTAGVRERIKSEVSGIKSTVKVDVEVDRTVLDRFERRLAGAAESAVSKYEPNLNLTVDDEILRRSLEAQLAELKGLAALPVALDPDIATRDKLFLQAELDALLARMQAHADAQPIKFKLEVDEGFQKNLYDLNKKVQAQKEKAATDAAVNLMKTDGRFFSVDFLNGKDEILTYRAEIDFANAEAQRVAWEEYANRNSLIRQKIRPDPDMGAFARAKFAIEALFSNIKVKIQERKWTADDLVPDMGNLKNAADGLAKVGAGAASALPSLLSFQGILLMIIAAVAVLLPPLLALGAGLATLAPSMLALIGPAAAIALGLEGIKKAAIDAGLFADSNGDKKGGGTVGAALDEIKKKVSDTFYNGLEPAFEKLGTIFPKIQEGMVGVAGGLTAMAQGFINAVSEGDGLKNLQRIIVNTGEGLKAAAPGIQSFTEGILDLVAAISDHFVGAGQAFSNWGDQFKRTVADWTKPGEDGMSRLDNLIKNVRTGVNGLIDVFKAFWDQGMKDIQDPNFGQGMKNFFDFVKEFVSNTLPALSEGFRTLTGYMETLAPLFKAIGLVTNAGNMFVNPGKTVNDIAARMQKAKEEGGSLVEQLKAGFLEVGSVDPFKELPGKGAAAGAEAGKAFNKGWVGAVDNAGAPAPGKVDTSGVLPTTPPDTTWWDTLKLKITTGVNELKATFAGLWASIVSGAISTFSNLGATVSGFFMTLPTTVGVALGQVVGTIFSSIVNTLSMLPVLVGGALATLPTIVGTALSGMVSAVVTKGGEIAAEVSTWPGRFIGALGSLAGSLVDKGTEFGQGFLTGLGAKVIEITTELSTWPGKFKNAVGDLSGTLADAGVQLVAGFIRGFTSRAAGALATVADWAGRLGGAARRALGIDSPSKVFAEIGENTGKGLVKGLEGQSEGIISTVRAIMQAMKDVFGSANGVNFNFNFGSAPGQLSDMASSAKTFSDGMASTLNPVKAGALDEQTRSQVEQLKQQNAVIDLQVAQLKAQRFEVDKSGKAALDAQIAELNARKANTAATIKQMEYDARYGAQAQQSNDVWKDMDKKIVDGITGVGQGVAQSYMQDFGISGNGALSALANYGIEAGTKFIFNVSNVEEAMAVQSNQVMKQGLGVL